jgi:hypothetical protein
MHASQHAAAESYGCPLDDKSGSDLESYSYHRVGTQYSNAKVANRNGRVFGWEIARTRPFRDARRFPSTRTEGYIYAAKVRDLFKDHFLSPGANPTLRFAVPTKRTETGRARTNLKLIPQDTAPPSKSKCGVALHLSSMALSACSVCAPSSLPTSAPASSPPASPAAVSPSHDDPHSVTTSAWL